MPFPFFAHQAPVVPLKIAMPRRWSGTGLVLGSMAPDFGYFLIGTGTAPRIWHRPVGVFLLCLPVSLVLYWLVTRVVAEPTARHLPMLGAFRLRGIGWLAAQPRTLSHWLVVAASIVVGAGTHLAWDLFTHTGSWMGDYIPFLKRELFPIGSYDVIGSDVLWVLSTLLGGLATLAALHYIGTRDLLHAWAEAREPGSTHGLDPYGDAATGMFWTLVVAVLAVAAVGSYVTRPLGFEWHAKATWVIVFLRATAFGFLALCIASVRERRAHASLSRRPWTAPARSSV